ncbi:MAG: hypothetical protein KDA44_08855 [Planctomycetales bacterium]|nr:hypothetical protein [Planctomycetales bacterium]
MAMAPGRPAMPVVLSQNRFLHDARSMIVYGFDSIAPMLEQDGYLFKMLANDSGVVFFPHTKEHRDATQPGIKYADDSRGNALAAMVKPGRIEIRSHRQFTDERVKRLIDRILLLPELEFARSFVFTYQARTLALGTD